MTKQEAQAEALARVEQSDSFANFPAIYEGFMARGIAEAEIQPRVNVLTYRAWQAKGRQVIRGEHGVKVQTWITIEAGTDSATGEHHDGYKKPKTATVFHVTQTKEADE